MLPFVRKASPAKRLSRLAAAMVLVAVAAPAVAQRIPDESWMGMYLGDAKVGYTSFRMDKSDFRGKPGYRLDSATVTRLVVLGTEVQQAIDSIVYLNSDFEPLREAFRMSSAGHETTITANFSAKEIVAEVESAGAKTTKKIPIPAGSKIVGDDTYFSPTMKLKVGDEMSLKFFNPLTLRLDDMHVSVLRKEELKLGDKSYEALVVRSLTPLGEMTCWQQEDGDVLKVTTVLGITMIREPKEVALSLRSASGSYSPPPSLEVVMSVKTTMEIPSPRQVKHLKVRLVGLDDEALVINDGRQKVELSDGEKPAAEYEITAAEFDRRKAASLPIKDAAMQEYLRDSAYVQPANPEIAAAAKKIVRHEKNAYAVASLLRAWVRGNMESRGDIGIVRSSVDVLHEKVGVCRDYAVLYTALARAAGVPTKMVAGLLFWKGGFYHHAWAESYVGEWIPIDPTLATDFVDATHIKLAEGDATVMFDTVKTMGTLKAEIIEFE